MKKKNNWGKKSKGVFRSTGFESYKLLPIKYYKYMFTKLTKLTEYYHLIPSNQIKQNQVKVKDDCPENFLGIMGIICSIINQLINRSPVTSSFQYYMYEKRTGRTLNNDLRRAGFIKSRGNNWITLKERTTKERKPSQSARCNCPENVLGILEITCNIVDNLHTGFRFAIYQRRTGRPLHNDPKLDGYTKTPGDNWITLTT
eukprot:Pgem_evm1s17078